MVDVRGSFDNNPDELVEFGVEARSQTRMIIGRFVRHRVAMVALVLLILMTLLAFLASHYYKWGYAQLTPDLSKAPSTKHWFGTDELGEDTYAKVMRGATKSIQVGLLVAFFSTVVGVLVGAVAGFYRGWIDSLLMRISISLSASWKPTPSCPISFDPNTSRFNA